MKSLIALCLLTLVACRGESEIVIMDSENNSGQSGTATFTEEGSTLKVEIRLSRSNDPGPQPVHIHQGRCGEIGPPLSTLPPDNVKGVGLSFLADPSVFGEASDGGVVMSRTELKGVSLKDLRASPFVVNAHDSRDLSLYVACGNIN